MSAGETWPHTWSCFVLLEFQICGDSLIRLFSFTVQMHRKRTSLSAPCKILFPQKTQCSNHLAGLHSRFVFISIGIQIIIHPTGDGVGKKKKKNRKTEIASKGEIKGSPAIITLKTNYGSEYIFFSICMNLCRCLTDQILQVFTWLSILLFSRTRVVCIVFC